MLERSGKENTGKSGKEEHTHLGEGTHFNCRYKDALLSNVKVLKLNNLRVDI